MRTRGFTLIELLVVIAVIGILAAMLLPALQGARARATAVTCLGHASGIGKAIGAYLIASGDILPPGKYAHQGPRPLEKVWMELLYEGDYIDDKKGFQCPSDDVTDNQSLYYDFGPKYPDWWASYAISQAYNDLYWETRNPIGANLANHYGNDEIQVLIGESDINFLSGWWFAGGAGDGDWTFRGSYEGQFPFRRHAGKCSYVMLDGHGQTMLVPASNEVDSAKYRSAIRSQFETCTKEIGGSQAHVCFWHRYEVGLCITQIDWE